MCGINGIISKKKIYHIEKRIKQMNASLKHRGPDADGSVVLANGKIALGQRRLAILDLDERSNQPFSPKCSENVLVYNGEIYNFQELKKEINYPFSTKSDTEVLFAGIEKNGIGWTQRCNGMFAYAFYDAYAKVIYLVRDRFGIKPLYYYYDGETVVFSSEIKGILNSGLVEARFNEAAIDEYLGNRYVREPYTFFEGIYQVPSASIVRIDLNLEISIRSYWKLPEKFNFDESYDENQIYFDFVDKLKNSVRRRLISDVNIGTYLSGGVDSSLITAIASSFLGNGVNTYTIGFEEQNEFEFARMVAKKYRTNHHEILMKKAEYMELWKEIIRYKDSPLGVPNEILLAKMSKVLKDDITVVLSGEGADELLGGYGRIYRSAFDFENRQAADERSFYSYFINKYEYVPRELRDKFLVCDRSLRGVYDKKISSLFEENRNEESIFRFFHTYHIKGLLQRVDTTTMYASVEARVPFLDHELVEFCYQEMPYSMKLRWNSHMDAENARKKSANQYSEILDTPKYALRKLGLELLPQKIVTRKKVGFPVPLSEWYNDLITLAQDVLPEAFWLKTDCINELCMACREDVRPGQLLWMFINIELFRAIYFTKEWRY